MRTNLIAALLTMIGLWSACSKVPSGPDIASGSKAGNPTSAFSGHLFTTGYYRETLPARNALVSLIPVHYNPILDTPRSIVRDTADTNGLFSFDTVVSDSYNIEFSCENGLAKAFIHSLYLSSTDSLKIVDTLESSTNLAGHVEQNVGLKVSARAFMPGTPYLGNVDSIGNYSLEKIPLGWFEIDVYVDSFSYIDSLIRNPIEIDTLDPYHTITVTNSSPSKAPPPTLDTIRINFK